MTPLSERLAELSGKATPGDWEWDAGLIPPDGPGRYADIYTPDEDGEPIIITEFNDGLSEGRSNAALIVELVNAYRWGWDWAALGMELHSWLLPHLGTTQMEAAQLGWQDYRDQEKQS